MIQEYVREMTADERAPLQRALRPMPTRARQTVLGSIESETWVTAGVALATGLAIAVVGAKTMASAVIAIAAGVALGSVPLARAAIRESRRLRFAKGHMSKRGRELAAMLEDGRVTVKRVRAVAVVEIEPIEDEGMGYVFDLGDGRVLFLKGQDYNVADDDVPWPNTEFEIVRAATDRTLLGLHCHGTALRPLRVIPREDVDPQKGWNEREEVLSMSVDEAVRTVLLEP